MVGTSNLGSSGSSAPSSAALEEYKIILDLPSESPALNFGGYAKAFKDIIENSAPKFAIGIFGEWGAGKTTLMQQIEELVREDGYVTVQFSAWRYEKEEHLIVPLLDTIRDSLLKWSEKHPDSRKAARETATNVTKVLRSMLAGLTLQAGVPGALRASFDANKALVEGRRISELQRWGVDAEVPQSFYHASFSALDRAFTKFAKDSKSRRIVVFVDDLDRCLPDGALQVIESMKLFFDLPGFVFVVGMNRSVVETMIERRYQEQAPSGYGESRRSYRVRGDEYIEKIFQVPFNLPPVSVSQLQELLDSMYSDAGLSGEQRDDIQEIVRPHLRYLVTGTSDPDEDRRSSTGRVNPREIKRYINAYTLTTKVEQDLDRDALLAFQTILFRRDWEVVRAAFYEHRDLFRSALLERMNGEDNAFDDLVETDPSLGAISQSSTFWTYVSDRGRRLLEVPSILPYIYATGAAIDFTPPPVLTEAVHEIGNMRRALKKLSEYVEQQKEIDTTSESWRSLAGELFNPQGLSIITESASQGPRSPFVLAALERLKGSSDFLFGTYDGSQDAFQSWYEQQKVSLDELVNYLRDLLNNPYSRYPTPQQEDRDESGESPPTVKR